MGETCHVVVVPVRKKGDSRIRIVTTPAVQGHIVHHARDRKRGMYETRAVVTPKGDYLLMFPDGGERYLGERYWQEP